MTNEFLTLRSLALVAGLLHFCQVPAMLVAPRMLGWEEDLGRLAPINRRIFQVMAAAILLTVLGSGALVAAAADEVAAGSRLGNGLCLFLFLFWGYRGAVQVLLYSRIWPGGALGRASHLGLTALFSFLTGAYGLLFWAGAAR